MARVTRIKSMPQSTADRTYSIQIIPYTYPVFITPSKAITPAPFIIKSFGALFHSQKFISADSFRTPIVYSHLGSGVMIPFDLVQSQGLIRFPVSYAYYPISMTSVLFLLTNAETDRPTESRNIFPYWKKSEHVSGA